MKHSSNTQFLFLSKSFFLVYLSFVDGEDIDMDIVTASSTSTWTITTTQILCSDTENLGESKLYNFFRDINR